MNLAGKNVLVTGGTGFVGSHLVEALVDLGAHVSTTFLTLDPSSYFFSRGLDKKVTQVQLNVNHFENVYDTLTKLEIDFVFHLAAQALVDVAYFNPKQTLIDNIVGTINILEVARLYPKIQGVIVASSDKAYGKTGEQKYVESTPLRGDHPYEVSKSAADLICTSYFKTYRTPVIITRFGNIYGEGDSNFSRIVPGTLEAAYTGKKLDIRSNGKHIRDYLYVKDVIDGYLLLAKNHKKALGEAYNFGSNDTLSVLDALKTVEKVTGQKIHYTIQNTAKNEIPYQSLSYKKINKEFGWSPKHSFSAGIEKAGPWYRKLLQTK